MIIKHVGLLALGLLLTAPAMAQLPARKDGKHLQNLDANGCALQGYDCVAMRTLPDSNVKGKSEFASNYQGAKYWFASVQNKKLFDGDPAKYAPLYGGFCALAVSQGNLRPIQVWTHQIVDGHLTVNHNAEALAIWLQKPEENLQVAQKQWPTVRQKAPKFDLVNSGETQQSVAATSYEGPR